MENIRLHELTSDYLAESEDYKFPTVAYEEERKKVHYMDNHRVIMDFEITQDDVDDFNGSPIEIMGNGYIYDSIKLDGEELATPIETKTYGIEGGWVLANDVNNGGGAPGNIEVLSLNSTNVSRSVDILDYPKVVNIHPDNWIGGNSDFYCNEFTLTFDEPIKDGYYLFVYQSGNKPHIKYNNVGVPYGLYIGDAEGLTTISIPRDSDFMNKINQYFGYGDYLAFAVIDVTNAMPNNYGDAYFNDPADIINCEIKTNWPTFESKDIRFTTETVCTAREVMVAPASLTDENSNLEYCLIIRDEFKNAMPNLIHMDFDEPLTGEEVVCYSRDGYNWYWQSLLEGSRYYWNLSEDGLRLSFYSPYSFAFVIKDYDFYLEDNGNYQNFVFPSDDTLISGTLHIAQPVAAEEVITYTKDDLICTYGESSFWDENSGSMVTRMGYRVSLPNDKLYKPSVTSIQLQYENTTDIADENLLFGCCDYNIVDGDDNGIVFVDSLNYMHTNTNCVDYENKIINVAPNWVLCDDINAYYYEEGYASYFCILSGDTDANGELTGWWDYNSGSFYVSDVNAILPFTATSVSNTFGSVLSSELNTWIYDPSQVFYGPTEESWISKPWVNDLVLTFDEPLSPNDYIVISRRDDKNNSNVWGDKYQLSNEWFFDYFEPLDDTNTKFKVLGTGYDFDVNEYYEISFYGQKGYGFSNNNGGDSYSISTYDGGSSSDYLYYLDETSFINAHATGEFGGTPMSVYVPSTKQAIYRVIGEIRQNITSTHEMFRYYRKMIDVNLKYFNPTGLTDTSDMFYDCEKVRCIDLAHIDFSNVTNVNHMFQNCASLEELIFPADLTSVYENSNTSYMFDRVATGLTIYHDKKCDDAWVKLMKRGNSILLTSNFTPKLSYGMTQIRATISATSSSYSNVIINQTQDAYLGAVIDGKSTSNGTTAYMTSGKHEITYFFLRDMPINCDNLFSGVNVLSIDFSDFDASNVTDMSQMFQNCITLQTVNWGRIDTSNVTNMSNMFYGCSRLTSLVSSHFDTSNVTNMSGMFYGCRSLTSLDVSNFDTSNVTSMYQMFSDCSGLTSLDLSTFNTSNVTSMESMFAYCYGLTSLDLSSFDTSKVTNMYQMFNYCYKLTSLDISNFDTSKVTDISRMFYSCSGLTSFDLSSLDVSKVTYMYDLFGDCRNLTSLKYFKKTHAISPCIGYNLGLPTLTSVDFSSWDVSNVTSVSGLCGGCTALTSVTFGEDFNTSNVTDMHYMFLECSSLTSLDVSSWDVSSVTNMNNMFSGCSNITSFKYFKKTSETPIKIKSLGFNTLTSIDFSGWDVSNVTNMSGLCSGCTTLTSVTFGEDFNTSNVTNMEGMFNGCGRLTSLDLSNFDTSNVTNMTSMFLNCNALTSLDVSNFDTSNVTHMGSMFGYCSGLTSLDLSNFDTSNVAYMGSMFYECDNLTSFDLSNFDVSNVINMSNMFYGCGNITSLKYFKKTPSRCKQIRYDLQLGNVRSIDFSEWDTSNVTNMSGLCSGCTVLTSVTLGEDFDTSNVTNMGQMFDSCRSLTSLDLSNFDTSKVTYMYAMFYGCSGLTSLDLNNFDTSKVTNMSHMFNGCSRLTSLDLSRFDTSNVTRMHNMFLNCNALTSLDLSRFDTSNVTTMSMMFTDCSGLTSLDLSSFDISNVTDMGQVFRGCSNLTSFKYFKKTSSTNNKIVYHLGLSQLTSIDFSSWDAGNITHMSGLCSGCTALTSVTFGDDIHSSQLTSVKNMFSGCTALTEANLGGLDISNTSDWRYIFSGCPNVTTFTYFKRTPATAPRIQLDRSGAACLRLSAVTSVDFSSWDASNVTSMSGLCGGCTALTSVTFGEYFDASNVTDMGYMFSSCESLTSLDLSSFNASNVTKLDYMFSHCSGLTSLDLSSFDTSKVTRANAMFYDCSRLTSLKYFKKTPSQALSLSALYLTAATSVDFSGWDASNVTSMSGLCSGCTTLTSVTFGEDFDTSNVTSMRYMFEGCNKLTLLDVSSFDTSNVTDMSWMFSGCSGLTSLDVSNFDTSNVIGMYSMFSRCTGLTSLDLSSFNTSNVTSMGYMFYYCKNLTELYIHGKVASSFSCDNMFDSVTTYGTLRYVDEGISPLIIKALPSTWTCGHSELNQPRHISFALQGANSMIIDGLVKYADTEMHYNEDMQIWEGDIVPTSYLHELYVNDNIIGSLPIDNIPSVVRAEDNITCVYFSYNNEKAMKLLDSTALVDKIYIDGEMQSIVGMEYTLSQGYHYVTIVDNGTRSMSEMFESCSQLTHAYCHATSHNITNMGYMFNGCTCLSTSVFTDDFDSSQVTNMSSMYQNCYKISHLDLNNLDTSNVTSMYGMFNACSGLTSLNVKDWDTSNVTTMSSMFSRAGHNLHLDISGWNTRKVTSMNEMFGYWGTRTYIESIVLPPNFGESCTNMNRMFMYCTMSTINAENINPRYVTDMSNMFDTCEYLTEINVSTWDTSHVTNMSEMFDTCTSLTSLDISNWDTSNVINMSGFVNGSYRITALTMTVDLANVSYSLGTISPSKVIYPCALEEMYHNLIPNLLTSSKYVCEDKVMTLTRYFNILRDNQLVVTGEVKVGDNVAAYDSTKKAWKVRVTTHDENFMITVDGNAVKEMNINYNNITYMCGDNQPHVRMVHSLSSTTTQYQLCRLSNITAIVVNGKEIATNGKYTPSVSGDHTVDVYLASNTTSLSGMCSGLTSLTSLELDNMADLEVNSLTYLACGCKSLSSVTFGDINTEKLTIMSYMFYNCSGLTSLDLSSINHNKVTTMAYMLYGCKQLTALTMSDNIQALTTTTSMFTNVTTTGTLYYNNLFDYTKILNVLPSSWVAQPTPMAYTRYFNILENDAWVESGDVVVGDTNATYNNDLQTWEITFTPTATTTPIYYNGTEIGLVENVNEINKAFYVGDNAAHITATYALTSTGSTYCLFNRTDLIQKVDINGETIDVSGLTKYKTSVTGNVEVKYYMSREDCQMTKANSMFSGCSAVTSVSWGEQVDLTTLTNVSYMFYNCYKLTSIDVSKFGTNNVTNMDYMFYRCSGLTSLDISSFNTSKVTSMNCMFYGCSKLTSIDVSKFDTSNVTNMASMFSSCSGLTSLDVSKFNTNNVTSMTNMFYGCSKLTSIDVSSFNTSNATNMTSMFSGCSGLTSLDVSKFNTNNATSMDYMFSNCRALTSLDVSHFNTSKVVTMNYMFQNCNALTSLDVSSWDTFKVSGMSNTFAYCSGLTSLNVSSWDTSNVTSMESMFNGCKGLTSLDVSNFDTRNVTNMDYMFGACSGVTSLDVKNWNVGAVKSMTYMFSNCQSLVSLDVKDWDIHSVSSVSGTFNSCILLNEIDLSGWDTNSVKNMGSMFANCSGLTSVIFGKTSNISKVTTFTNMFNNVKTNGRLVYPYTYHDYWYNILITSQSTSKFPSTWVAESSYTPHVCTSLVISALDVSARATATTITYTATTNGYDAYAQVNVENIKLTGVVASNSFEQNTSYTDTIERVITFEYMGVTASTTITQGVWSDQSYEINLNNQWEMSTTIANPDSSLYDGVYQSFSNKGTDNSIAKMTIKIVGYDNFKLYIRSYAESNYDYVMVSQLDVDISSGTSYSDTSYVKAHTRSKSTNTTTINGYTLVEFTGIDSDEHIITVGYRKDSSSSTGDDRGYLLIPKDQ